LPEISGANDAEIIKQHQHADQDNDPADHHSAEGWMAPAAGMSLDSLLDPFRVALYPLGMALHPFGLALRVIPILIRVLAIFGLFVHV
jgi:hypothetical protein